MPETESYAKSVNKSNLIADNLNKIIVFGNSIVCGTRVRKFNLSISNGYATFKVFPGANSKELLHCIDPTLENGSYNAVALNAGVN